MLLFIPLPIIDSSQPVPLNICCHPVNCEKTIAQNYFILTKSKSPSGECHQLTMYQQKKRGLGGFIVHNTQSACSVVSDSLWPHGLQAVRLLSPWNFPGKNTGAGCHFLLQGIIPTQGSNPCLLCLLHWQVRTLPLAPPEGEKTTAKRHNLFVL